jgi:hypothetical protein
MAYFVDLDIEMYVLLPEGGPFKAKARRGTTVLIKRCLLLLLLLLLLTGTEMSLGGSSLYTSTDKTNNKYT